MNRESTTWEHNGEPKKNNSWESEEEEDEISKKDGTTETKESDEEDENDAESMTMEENELLRMDG
eukprot:3037647-Ditylum_brightwellii.AAC.1